MQLAQAGWGKEFLTVLSGSKRAHHPCTPMPLQWPDLGSCHSQTFLNSLWCVCRAGGSRGELLLLNQPLRPAAPSPLRSLRTQHALNPSILAQKKNRRGPSLASPSFSDPNKPFAPLMPPSPLPRTSPLPLQCRAAPPGSPSFPIPLSPCPNHFFAPHIHYTPYPLCRTSPLPPPLQGHTTGQPFVPMDEEKIKHQKMMRSMKAAGLKGTMYNRWAIKLLSLC